MTMNLLTEAKKALEENNYVKIYKDLAKEEFKVHEIFKNRIINPKIPCSGPFYFNKEDHDKVDVIILTLLLKKFKSL